jgi:hypothetical protein
MSDEDGNDISKIIIFTLGLAAIGFLAYLVFKEIKGYQLGGCGIQQPQQMSLSEDNGFQLERRLHLLEMDRIATDRNARTVRTLQPVVGVTGTEQKQVGPVSDYLQNPDAPQIPRKVVSMNTNNMAKNVPNIPNINGLSKGDQDKIRRMFFNML